MARTILVVDDLKPNRLILREMLRRDYDILEAAGGEQALDILDKRGETVSAVLLDISMPGIDGFEVLNRIRANKRLSQLPVIMITGSGDRETRVKSLALGANDFVMKPYSSQIIKHCLQNNIAFSEAAATVSSLRRDKLTGLYSRETFFDIAREMVCEREAGHYIMACFDIDRFKIINDQYGQHKGDEVLGYIADVFREGFEPHGGICCRVFNDNFAVLYPTEFSQTRSIPLIWERASHIEGLASPIHFCIGRYKVDDKSLSAAAMYDRARLAANTIKGRYDQNIAVYDDSMLERLISEQEIVQEMERALESGQFEVWFQPQFNYSTDAMIGAEALVRWRHPRKGLIPPNEFIHLFEQNGFVYSLDKFVWERVCALLREWRDAGRDPLPISVNISRYDALRPDTVQVLTGIVNKYGLPKELLRLEITESAFSESSQTIVDVAKELLRRGFTVEIDDFGSGYSSLNTLKDVPAQIIKLDMKFLESSDDNQRGGNIVESIVRMAKWLGMSVIAEGVETLEQARFLSSIGCNYMQGYLYAKPMSRRKYEEFCRGSEKEERLITLKTVENLDNNAFWDPKSMDTLIFNSYVGGACIYEYHAGKIELLRATRKYAQIVGGAGLTVEEALRIDWARHLDKENLARVIADIKKSADTKGEVTGEYVFHDLPDCPREVYLRCTMRVIAAVGERFLVYCTNENITAQRVAEKRERENEERIKMVSEQLRAIMDSVDQGIIAAVVENGAARYLFANDRYYEMLGYTKEQFEREIRSPYQTVAEEDRSMVREETSKINVVGESVTLVYNALTRDGRKRVFRSSISTGALSGVDKPVQFTVLRDITEETETGRRERLAAGQLKSLIDDMPGGFARMKVEGDGVIRPVYLNDGFLRLVGITREEALRVYGEDAMAGVHPDDAHVVREAVAAMFKRGEAQSARYRLRSGDGGYVWLSVFGRVSRDIKGDEYLNIYYTDASERAMEEKTQKDLLDNLPGGAGVYEFKNGQMSLTYQNKSYWEMVGLKEEAYPDAAPMSAIHPDDINIVMRELFSAIEQKRDLACDVRLRHLTKGYIPVRLAGRVARKSESEFVIYVVFFPAESA